MSLTSNFLKKHESIADAVKVKYPNYSVAKSENELSLSSFPAIGVFLGVSQHNKASRTYVPYEYSYVLCVFDVYDFDSATDLLIKQQETFEMLEKIIEEMSFSVLTDIEPAVSIGIDEGSFITGWTTSIKFNAQ